MASPSLNLPTLQTPPASTTSPLTLNPGGAAAAGHASEAPSPFAGMLQRRQNQGNSPQHPQTGDGTATHGPGQTRGAARNAAADGRSSASANATNTKATDAAAEAEAAAATESGPGSAVDALLASIPGLNLESADPRADSTTRGKGKRDASADTRSGAEPMLAGLNPLALPPTNIARPGSDPLASEPGYGKAANRAANFAGSDPASNLTAPTDGAPSLQPDPRSSDNPTSSSSTGPAAAFSQLLAQASGTPRPTDSLPTGIAHQLAPGNTPPPGSPATGLNPGLPGLPGDAAPTSTGNTPGTPLRNGETSVGSDTSGPALASLLQSQGVQHLPQQHPVAQAPAVPVHTPAGAPGWTEEVSERVSWVASQKESRADLVLNPPELGRIEVSITINGDQTSAQFMAANPVTRELLEQSLPTLRDSLAQNGLQLSQADVGSFGAQGGQQSGQPGDGQRRGRPRYPGSEGVQSAPLVSQQAPTSTGRGLVDTFA